jgi:hypothetical protein
MAAAEGSILAVERRILVPDEYAATAKDVLKQLDAPPVRSSDSDEDPDTDPDGEAS